ncbi:LysM domain / peptidase, M23 family multi-domain protein [Leptospira licerasiae serovar Varillal str. VAR 010]|uniref:Peptidase, M23 family n=2 Tax=Leptospira licerasiae TaxID=447106 RepID=A0ABP2RA04_9LEPT|nr:LysM peptidoglycan-binding domain-containing M23 family metallopeptidase [Leptospira licerasiae]EIE02646.1 LysM domain / peptidase, M23 family multi-domain protein [Leptospira licerasiae serovar Varillal str. VAR 010]EJZ41245.1 peptidase, M23 family [Leptospira licerasiae str. MMD4847]
MLLIFFPSRINSAGTPLKIHTVQPKETAFSISQKYKLDWRMLLEWNGKKENEGLKAGEKLKIPQNLSYSSKIEKNLPEDTSSAAPKFRSPLKVLPPVSLPYSNLSYYPNKGVLFKASRHKDVHPVRSGKVVVLDQMDGYRKYIILEHKGGYSSVYANLRSVSVKEGETVKTGDSLGELEEGKGLYFQINQGAKAVDPIPLLKY